METFNTYIIYIQEILTRIHKHVPTDKICTLTYELGPKMGEVLLENGQYNDHS